MEGKKKGAQLRPNVLIMAGIAAGMVIGLSIVFPEEATAVIAVGGTVAGGCCAAFKEMISPKPSEPEPEPKPEPMVPESYATVALDAVAQAPFNAAELVSGRIRAGRKPEGGDAA